MSTALRAVPGLVPGTVIIERRTASRPPSRVWQSLPLAVGRRLPQRRLRPCGVRGNSTCCQTRLQAVVGEGAAMEAATEAAKYVPSPLDYSTLVPQLVAMGVLGICLLYFIVVLAPTAQVKFDMKDAEKRAQVKSLKKDDSRPLQKALYGLWLKPLARPRGDQTRGGAVIPGFTDTAAKNPSSSEARKDNDGATESVGEPSRPSSQ